MFLLLCLVDFSDKACYNENMGDTKTIYKEPQDSPDREIGRRLKQLRATRGMTLDALASLIGITFQQLHKYEMGTARMSAHRLHLISKVFKVDVNYFYGEEIAENKDFVVEEERTAYSTPLNNKESNKLLTAYWKIDDVETRNKVLMFVETMAAAPKQTKNNKA